MVLATTVGLITAIAGLLAVLLNPKLIYYVLIAAVIFGVAVGAETPTILLVVGVLLGILFLTKK